jgi:hypothetical protein
MRRAAVMDTYRPLLEGRTPPDSVGRRIAVGRRTTGEMMLAPAASPDGRLVAFLWARDFSIDLYLADARTGTVLRRLASGAAQSRFDALSYMGSAGTWSPDGVQFATVVFADGGQELAIIDVASGRIQRRIRVADVNGIASPAWSPDGRSIAFSGATGGRRDLYLLDVATGRARRLTDDAFAELQPAWSPDGGTIAFSTDRDDIARFERLEHASMRIGLFDVATGAVRTLSLVGGAATDPQFSPDGRSLYFLAAPDGFRDLYRVDLETGAVFRVTRVATGISGLTPVSPALSVAPGTGDVFFTLFDRRGYVITALDAASARGGEAFSATNAAPERAAVLPPGSTADAVEAYLADADRGMPVVAEFTSSDYRPRPKLSHVGVPSLGVGIDRYSTGVYASVEAYFTDVLGDHGLYTNAIANGGWGELGGQLFYENRSRRLNWGVGVGHVPYLNRAVYAQPVRGTDGSGGTLITEYRERLVYDEAGASARYPLSTTRRIEVSAGVQRISYEYELNRRIESGGRIVDQQSIDLIAPIRLNMAQAGIALVGDHSIFGIASPVDGGRYRFEVQPTVGTLDFVAATADWRNYTYRRPFTLAVRALHYGRYGPDAERAELGLLYLGSQGLVRGYDYQSYTAAECASPAGGPTGCGALDRLFGSRLAVAGVELRAPLFGNERIGLFNVGFLPTELAVFFDAGAAWSADRSFSLDTGAAGGPVTSAGLSARFNLFGAMILETYYALPLQRTTGGRFGFQLTPGW